MLSHIRNQETTLKYVSLWAGKEARTYPSKVSEDSKDSLGTMLYTIEDWTKPKSDKIAAFTHLRALNQGNKTLSAYIQEVRRVVDLCNFTCGRLQGEANQKVNCGWSLKYKGISAVYFKRIQSQSKWVHQNLPNRGCHMQTVPSPSPRVYRLWGQYISSQTDPILSAAKQAKLQGRGAYRDMAMETRLQTQSLDCMWTMWLRPSQVQRRV